MSTISGVRLEKINMTDICRHASTCEEKSSQPCRVKLVGSSVRWVAVEVDSKYIKISLHLPHRKEHVTAFTDILEELSLFVLV